MGRIDSQGEDGPTSATDDAQTPALPPPPPPPPPIPYSGAPLPGAQQPLSQPSPPPSPPQPPETSDMPLQGAASDTPYTSQAQQDYAPYGNPPLQPPDQPLPPPPPPPPIPPQASYPDSQSYQPYTSVDAGRYEQPAQAYPPSGYSTGGDYPMGSQQAWDSAPDYRVAPPPRGGIPLWAIIAPAIAVLLVGVGLLSWGLIGQGGSSKSSGSTADATPTRVAQARTTIPIATLPSGRATARATATKRVVVAPTATQTAIADDNSEMTGRLLYASAVQIFGPINAELKHDPASGTLKVKRSGVSMRDFVVEAVFSNPYDASRGTWDYGFMFRESGDVSTRLIVTGDAEWQIKLIGKAATQSGTLPELDTSPGGVNNLTLVAKGNKGYFFVNTVFIDALDLSANMEAGDVAVGTGFFTGAEIAGESTSVFSFGVGQLP